MDYTIDEVLYLKLVSGEILLAEIDWEMSDDEFYFLLKPIQIFVTNTLVGGALRAAKYLPFAEGTDAIDIRAKHVMLLGPVTVDVKSYYHSCVAKLDAIQEQAAMAPSPVEVDDDEDPEVMQAMMERFSNTNIQIH